MNRPTRRNWLATGAALLPATLLPDLRLSASAPDPVSKPAPATGPAPVPAAAPGKTVHVGVGYGGRRILSEDGGKTWTITAEWAEKGGDDANNLMGLAYGKGRFVATGGGGGAPPGKPGGHVLVSTDGRTWREVHTGRFRIHPVMFGGDRFVAGGPGRNFLWSVDGETWTEGAKITAKEASHFRQGAFGNGVFVFLGNAGGNSPVTWVAVTKDGTALDHVDVTLPPVRGLVFAEGKFVAVGPGGLRMHSKDGREWTKCEAVADAGDLTWVTWTGTEFVSGGGKVPLRSADGVKWEPWPARIPCHVQAVSAAGWVGTSWPGQMWHSPDGRTWTKCPAMAPNGINRVVIGVASGGAAAPAPAK